MIYKRKSPVWVQPFFIILFVSCTYALMAGVRFENWKMAIISALALPCIIAGYVFILMSAKYYVTEDCFHIKGINYGHRADEKIDYRDILYLQRFQWNKVDFIRVTYWYDIKATYIDIPAPSRHVTNNREQKLIDSVIAKKDSCDQSHIVSPKFRQDLSSGVMVDINDGDCLYMDYYQFDKNVLMAIIRDCDRLILLGNCERYSKDVIVETSPPKIEKSDYIYCNFLYMQHLEYATLEDALADMTVDADGAELRTVDCISMSLNTLSRDIRSERSRKV